MSLVRVVDAEGKLVGMRVPNKGEQILISLLGGIRNSLPSPFPESA
jgi:hypothetical protein